MLQIMKRALIAIVLAAALVLAGCAGPGGEGVNNTTNETDGAMAGNDTGNDTGFGDDGANDTNDTAFGEDNDTNVSVAVVGT